jgi:hypothetical protein
MKPTLWANNFGPPVKFKSDFSLEESVKRLEQRTKSRLHTFGVGIINESILVGKITKDRVELFRVRPSYYNSSRPHLFAVLKEENGTVTLEGSFDVARWVKAMSLLSLPIFILVAFVLILVPWEPNTSMEQMISIALFLPSFYLVTFVAGKLLKRFDDQDIDWISNEVAQALSGSSQRGGSEQNGAA